MFAKPNLNMFKAVKKTFGKVKSRCTGASASTLLLSGSSVPESPGERKLWNCSNKKQTRTPAAQEACSLDAGLTILQIPHLAIVQYKAFKIL